MIVFSYHSHRQHNVHANGIVIDEQLLSPQYWLNKIKDQDVIMMTPDDIEAFNENLMEVDDHVEDILSFSKTIDKVNLTSMIKSLSSVPGVPRFYANGEKLKFKDYHRYIDNMNFRSIKETNPVQFGLVAYRVALRTFPTFDRVFKNDMDTDFDRFQESALFPGEAVVVLHTSKDKEWYFVRNYHNFGWVDVKAVALGGKKEVQRYQQAELFVMVTGDKIITESNAQSKFHVPELQLDMGTRLPLVEDHEQENSSTYAVLLPVRNHLGNLNFTQLNLPRNKDLSIGYLPFTRANIMKQAFKFLGERYGWGHDFMARDCSGFAGDVYKSFGLLMPRNTGEQGKGSYGINYRFGLNNNNDDKLVFINQLEIGDLIYMPGHVVMYIGDNGKPHIIQDTPGVNYLTDDGCLHRDAVNGVVITELLPLHMTQNATYLDRIYSIKRIRALEYTCY